MSTLGYGAPSARAVDAILQSGYTPPSALAADAELARSGIAYGPPAALAVDAVLQTGYSVPTALALDAVLDYPPPPNTIEPAGLNSLDVGLTQVATLQVSGLAASAVGSAFVAYAVRTVEPAGLLATSFGAHALEFDSTIQPESWIVQTAVSTPTLQHDRRLLRPAGVDSYGAGAPAVTHWLQRADIAGRGPGPTTPPAPIVTASPRTLEVPWSVMSMFGTPMIGFDRELSAQGFDATLFGLAAVLDNSQTAGCTGIAPDPPPAPTIYLTVRNVRPGGFLSQRNDERFGQTLINNEDQQITTYDAWERERVSIVPMPVAALFDRPVWPIGQVAGEVSTRVDVTHLNTPLRPAGLDSAGIGEAFISHEHRTLEPPGAVLGWFGAATAYNDARVLTPAGLSAGAIGAHLPRHDLRFVTQNTSGNAPHSSYGTAFVADAERTVTTVVWTQQTRVGNGARASLWENTMSPAGLAAGDIGGHYFQAHRNVIAPSGMTHTAIAAPTARRISIDPEGRAMFDAGQPRLLRDPEPVSVLGDAFGGIGAVLVYPRNRTIYPQGNIGVIAIPLQHQVRNEIPEPPGERTVLAGALGPPEVPTNHVVQSSRLIVPGLSSAAFGQPTLRGSGIQPASIPPPGFGEGGNVGVPMTSGDRTLSLDGLMPPEISEEHRLSPHYILGPVGLGDGHIMDYYTHGPGHTERPVFGTVSVQNQHRTLQAAGLGAPNDSAVHSVSHFHRTVSVPGLKSWRVGIAKLPAGIPVRPLPIDSLEFGAHTVARVIEGDQTITVESDPSQAFGELTIEHQDRAVVPGGFDAALFGMAWVDRAVRSIDAPGLAASLFGTADASHFVRTLELDGWDSAQVTHAPGETRWRMRVTRGTAPATPAVLCAGIDAGAIGTPRVSHFEQVIGCGGIQMPQAPVPAPTLQPSNVVLPHGSGASLDYLAMGAPAMWVPGDPLVPFAVDMALFGAPRVAAVATPAAIEDSAIGTASMVRPLDPLGDLYTLFGSHLLAHGDGVHVCGQLLRGIRSGDYEFGAIGAPGVAHD